MSYLETTHRVYQEAATTLQKSLCCTPGRQLQMPGLVVPERMAAMNYGCGSTVHPGEIGPAMDVLYIGVGSGLEALQFSYFTRRPESVLAVDRVPEMLEVARVNFAEAAASNAWFRPEFVSLLEGDALALPVPDGRVDLVAQNCLFNIFTPADLSIALAEVHRVLKPGGRLLLSDPISEHIIPQHLRDDERLRAECLSGALSLAQYLELLVDAGFGTIEIRGRRPYRVLDAARYGVATDLLLESVEVVAIKGEAPPDGACVFAGECAFYVGAEETFDDGLGHVLVRDVPLSICRKTAQALRDLGRKDLVVTEPTWHYGGGGCC